MNRSLVDPRMLDELVDSGYYPLRCDIQEPLFTAQPSGQQLTTGWQTIPGLENIPCAVNETAGQERRMPDDVAEIGDLRIVLAGFFPQLVAGGAAYPNVVLAGHPATYRAVLSDGRICDIMVVDHGMLRLNTALQARTIGPEAIPGA